MDDAVGDHLGIARVQVAGIELEETLLGLVVADFDGDAVTDYAALQSSTVSVAFGTGGGAFAAPSANFTIGLYGGALGSTYTKANPPMHALDWLLRPDTAKPDLSQPAALQLWRAEAEQPFAEKGPQPGRGTRHSQGLANIVATLSSTDVIALREPP